MPELCAGGVPLVLYNGDVVGRKFSLTFGPPGLLIHRRLFRSGEAGSPQGGRLYCGESSAGTSDEPFIRKAWVDP